MKRSIIYIISLALVGCSLSGCGGSSSAKAGYAAEAPAMMTEDAYDDYEYASDDLYMNSAMAEAIEEPAAAGGSYSKDIQSTGNDEILTKNRKIIKNVNITAETEEFDALLGNINSKVTALGGYMSNTNISGRSITDSRKGSFRHADLTVRIPAKNLDAFLNNIEKSSNITYRNDSAEDVTLNYADTKARIDSLRTEQKRLNELIETADSVDTLIILEQRLTEVRYEIESYESRLRTMDDQIEYSTIYLSINEVEKYTPDPVVEVPISQRIAEGFTESFHNVCEDLVDFFVKLIIDSPYLIAFIIILGVIALVVFLIIKLIIFIAKKSDARREKKAPAKKIRAEAANTDEVKASYETLKPVVLPDKNKDATNAAANKEEKAEATDKAENK